MIEPETRPMQRESETIARAAGSRDGTVCVQRRGLDALFLLNTLGIGGSERKIVRLANRLTKRHMRIGLAWLNGPESLAPMLHGDVARWNLERRGKFSWSALAKLKSIVNEHRPRVLLCVNLYPTLYAAGVALGMGADRPKLVGLVNTTDFGPGERWRQRFFGQILNRFDWTIFGCERQLGPWIGRDCERRERAEVIYNGIDLDEFDVPTPDARRELRRRYGYSERAFIVGCVGNLNPSKNQRALIDSIARLRSDGIDARLILVGDGPLRARLEAQASALGIGAAVTFTGLLDDVRPVLSCLDVFALPSLYIETFSNAALEAMSMGVPVVLSRIGGADEMIRDGIEGLLIEPSALDALLPEKLRELATDPMRRRVMGECARQRVECDFSLERMVDRYASTIERLAA
ncbi:MAG TPA: glycosyltransferase family 4 protein [Steroidobacteraceae bacterium]